MIWFIAFLLFVFNANVSYADLVTQNVTNGCQFGFNENNIYAKYAPDQYTCSSGYYLPANAISCVACPSEHTCSGGTYTFNPDINQGIVYNSPVSQNITYGCNAPLVNVGTQKNINAQFAPNEYTCSSGEYLPADGLACETCLRGYTCAGGTYPYNATNDQGIVINSYTCSSGEYLPADTLGCETCPRGYTCAGGTYPYNANSNSGIVISSYTCAAGEYLPADGLACETCPRGHTCAGGTFNYNANDDQGIVINTYTCSPGQYLPANAIACETCPTGHTCAGGTFTFNAKDFQGLVLDTDSPIPANTNVCAENFPPSLKATYDINTYTCSPGYYLPADATECVKCLENNYCVGGSYTFNPTDNQGITHCSGDLRAPAGMWEAEQCGRRLNIGGKYVYSRSTRKTHPSINLDMDLDGTTEFYISLSTTPVPMNADFKNLTEHNKLVIDLPKAYINSAGIYIPAGKYYAYDDTITDATPFETAE